MKDHRIVMKSTISLRLLATTFCVIEQVNRLRTHWSDLSSYIGRPLFYFLFGRDGTCNVCKKIIIREGAQIIMMIKIINNRFSIGVKIFGSDLSSPGCLRRRLTSHWEMKPWEQGVAGAEAGPEAVRLSVLWRHVEAASSWRENLAR